MSVTLKKGERKAEGKNRKKELKEDRTKGQGFWEKGQ
jgi:hypothetical protein